MKTETNTTAHVPDAAGRTRRPGATGSSALLVGLVLASATPCFGQGIIHDIEGQSSLARFGHAVAGIGDFNKDGHDDFIVGEPKKGPSGHEAGMAHVISGKDGSILHSWLGLSAEDQLGASVASAGDVNADGYPDVIIGAPFHDGAGVDAGMVMVCAGPSGDVLHTILGQSAGERFGTSVAGIGDMDGDGKDDVLIGAPYADKGFGVDTGEMRMYRGDGTMLGGGHWPGSSHDLFGMCVGSAGDVNGDGFIDTFGGAPFADLNGESSGRLFVYSGKSSGLIDTIVAGDSAFEYLGWSASAAGDLDQDGFDDLLIGAPRHGGVSDPGRVLAFSMAKGQSLFTLEGTANGDAFGNAVASAGDVDQDGIPDLVIGAPDHGEGMVLVASGKDGAPIYSVIGNASGDCLGTSVSGAGDVDDDGFADIVAGAPEGGVAQQGFARVYGGLPGDGSTAVGTTLGDKIVGTLDSLDEVHAIRFMGLEGSKTTFQITAQQPGGHVLLTLLDPQGAVIVTKEIVIKKKKTVKFSYTFAGSGEHELRIRSVYAPVYDYALKTELKLGKKASKQKAKVSATYPNDVVELEIAALPGAELDAKLKKPKKSSGGLQVTLVDPTGANVDLTGSIVMLPNGSISLSNVPLDVAGKYTLQLQGFTQKSKKWKVTLNPTQPPKGTDVIAMP